MHTEGAGYSITNPWRCCCAIEETSYHLDVLLGLKLRVDGSSMEDQVNAAICSLDAMGQKKRGLYKGRRTLVTSMER